MSDSRAGPYRVRIAGQEIVLPDLDAVRRLSEGGQLGGAVDVRAPGSDAWVPLATVLAGPPPRQNPWDVWEQADEVDPKEIWREYSTGSHPVVPPRPDEADELPPSALAPVEDEQRRGPRMVIDGGRRPPSGKVIAFPNRAGAPAAKVEGSQALAPAREPDLLEVSEPAEPVPLRPAPRPVKVNTLPAQPEPPARTRWPALLAVTALGLAVVGGVRWWIVGQATESFPVAEVAPTPTVKAPSTPTPSAPVEATPAPTSAAAQPYAELEATLRARLPPDIREVTDDVSLEDALTVELHAMRLNVLRVEAPVVGWVGRPTDKKPKIVELTMHLRTDPDRFDSDLGAAALVVGKYLQRYGFEMPRCEVVFEGLTDAESKITISPESARLLYLGRKDLLEFLRTR